MSYHRDTKTLELTIGKTVPAHLLLVLLFDKITNWPWHKTQYYLPLRLLVVQVLPQDHSFLQLIGHICLKTTRTV